MSDDKTHHLIQLLKDDNQTELDAIYKQKGWKNDIDFKTIYDAIFNLENPSIHKMIGYMYSNGHYVEQDYEKAFHFYKLSADKGNHYAQNNIGVMYYNGEYVIKDYETAFRYFQLSADQGNHIAKYNLGHMYREGRYVEKDYEKAFHSFQLSADQGYKHAKHNIKTLIKIWDNADEYITKLNKKVIELENENNNLKKDISNLEQENTELRYTPGNIGYQEAEKHWNEML